MSYKKHRKYLECTSSESDNENRQISIETECIKVKRGHRGHRGDDGCVGPVGPSFGISYADFYALMPSDNAAIVPVGGDVDFPNDGPFLGTDIIRTGASTFNLVCYWNISNLISSKCR